MNENGYVYFFHNKTSNCVKIGFSIHNPLKRLGTVKNASPDDIQFAGAIRGTMKDEKDLHKKFRKFRIKREWFKPEVLSFLENVRVLDISEFIDPKLKRDKLKEEVFFQQNIKYLIGNSSINSLASECEIPQSVLHSWVKDKIFPSSKNFHLVSRIAKKYNVPLNDLFFKDITVSVSEEVFDIQSEEGLSSFGKNLKHLMKQKNISASRLGNDIGVSPKTVLEWVGDKNRMPRSLDHIKILKNYFSISTHRLLFGEDDINEFIDKEKDSSRPWRLMDHIGELSDEYEIVIRKIR